MRAIALQPRFVPRDVGPLIEDAGATNKAIGSVATRRHRFTVALPHSRVRHDEPRRQQHQQDTRAPKKLRNACRHSCDAGEKDFHRDSGKTCGGSRSAQAQLANPNPPGQAGSAGLALIWQRTRSVSSSQSVPDLKRIGQLVAKRLLGALADAS